MPYTFETNYDFKALTAMARALRKTVRRKTSRRVRVFGGIAVAVGLLLAVPWYQGYEFGLSTAVTILAVAVNSGVVCPAGSVGVLGMVRLRVVLPPTCVVVA